MREASPDDNKRRYCAFLPLVGELARLEREVENVCQRSCQGGCTINNRVLRLPAIVLLNTTFEKAAHSFKRGSEPHRNHRLSTVALG